MEFGAIGITPEMLKEFEYIEECIYSTDIDEDMLQELEGCKCTQPCSVHQNCSCLLFCQAYSSGGLLKSDSDSGILECSSECSCSNCWNTVVQKSSKAKVKVVDSGIEAKRYQVIALEKIVKGTFVAEYTGEVLCLEEARERLSYPERLQNNYLLCIGEIFNDSTMITCIDARHYGNVSRFINHGCDPNLEIKLVRTGMLIPRFCLFAKRDIFPSEELSYNYGIEYTTASEAGPACHCGATNCRGFLPFSQIPPSKTVLILSSTLGKNNGQRTIAPRAAVDITPIPMENLNPRLTEFRRIDSNGDNSLTFTEFLLGDRPYIETQSRNFHSLDTNSDGQVSRDEFEAFYRQQDEIHRRLRSDGFFKQLVSLLYGIWDEENLFRLQSVKASQTGTGPIIVNFSTNNDTTLPKFFIKPFF